MGPMLGTTILAVRRNDKLVFAGDGQVTFNNTILKATARKVQRMYHGQVLGGFAGSVADSLTLFERFERRLEETSGNLAKAAYELARDWRGDKLLRRLEAMLMVGNKQDLLLLSGNGEVIRPDEEIASIGSGSPEALSAAKALLRYSDLDAEAIVRAAMEVAAELCIYTNTNITVEVLD